MTNCTIDGTHHGVTTSGGDSNAANLIRWGNVLNLVVSNNTFVNPVYFKDGQVETSVVADTHAEGWGVVFSDNVFNMGGVDRHAQCLDARSRNCVVKNNVFRRGTGVLAWAPDFIIANNVFEDCTYAILQYNNKLIPRQNVRIMNNSFLRTSYRDLTLSGDNCQVYNNNFSSAPLVFENGKDHNIINVRKSGSSSHAPQRLQGTSSRE